jgi:hypothetical protein
MVWLMNDKALLTKCFVPGVSGCDGYYQGIRI